MDKNNGLTKGQIEFIQNYDFDRNVIITGSVGTGKTFQARRLLKKYQIQYKNNPNKYGNGLFYEISDARFKEELGSGNLRLKRPEERANSIEVFPLEMMLRSRVLLLDDIGVSDTTDAYIRKLTYVLDTRMERGLPTIFTTNLNAKQLEDKLDTRIKSRVFNEAFVMVMTGEDRRKNNITTIT